MFTVSGRPTQADSTPAPAEVDASSVQSAKSGARVFFPISTIRAIPLAPHINARAATHGARPSIKDETYSQECSEFTARGGGASEDQTISGAASTGRGGAQSDRGAAAEPQAPLLTTAQDLAIALAILAVAACAGWVLLAYPLVREIAWGSVAALPGWVWVGFAVVFGAMAGGQVR